MDFEEVANAAQSDSESLADKHKRGRGGKRDKSRERGKSHTAANPATTKTRLKTLVLTARFSNAVSLTQRFLRQTVIGTPSASVTGSVGFAMRWKSCSNLATSSRLTWEDIRTTVTTNDGVGICQLTRDGRSLVESTAAGLN
jgi:hypothetical protein